MSYSSKSAQNRYVLYPIDQKRHMMPVCHLTVQKWHMISIIASVPWTYSSKTAHLYMIGSDLESGLVLKIPNQGALTDALH